MKIASHRCIARRGCRSVRFVSGDAEAVFARCKTQRAIQRAIDDALAQESWPDAPRRIEVAEIQLARGWCMLVPLAPSFFLARGDTSSPRIARFARALGAPVYEVVVRSSVATTLIEANALGQLRISGHSFMFVGRDDPGSSRRSPARRSALVCCR
jgi:hypothetical protein